MSLRRRRPAPPEAATELARLIVEERDTLDSGQLVRALARSVVHVPMPGLPPEKRPRLVSATGPQDGPPLYVIEDDAGHHALLYTSMRRLVEAWGEGITAATVPFVTLLMGWPSGVDVVLDAGHPEALEVPAELVRDAALDAAGVPTGTSLQPSPAGVDARVPDPEPVQVIGVTRELAARTPEVRALHRAELVDREPAARPVLGVVVDLDPVDEHRLDEVMTGFVRAVSQVDPNPIRLLPVVADRPSRHPELVDAVRGADTPYWTRPER